MQLKLSGLLTLTMLLGGSVQAQATPQPVWIKMFGDVSANAMNKERFQELKAAYIAEHANSRENRLMAEIWRFNGTLPLQGPGYYLLARSAAEELKAGCTYPLLNGAFCVASYAVVKNHHENKAIGEREREAPINQTRLALRALSTAEISELHETLHMVEGDIYHKTPQSQLPPEPYFYLGQLKGYLMGLDAHSNLIRKSALESKLKTTLSIKLEGSVIIVNFDAFSSDIAEVVADELSRIYRPGDRILFDLRGNRGGYRDAGVNLAKLFLPKEYLRETNEALLFTNAMRFGAAENDPGVFVSEPIEIAFSRQVSFADVPLAILVDQDSCSSTEIFSSLLQQRSRALLIGNQTCGKGTIQHTYQVGQTELVTVLTTGIYSTRDGSTPQITGLTPHLNFPLSKLVQNQKLYESEQPFALKTNGPVRSFDKDKPELPQSVLNCATKLGRQRGRGPLRQNEALSLGLSVLNACYAT